MSQPTDSRNFPDPPPPAKLRDLPFISWADYQLLITKTQQEDAANIAHGSAAISPATEIL